MRILWGSLLLLTSLSAGANEVFAPSDIPLLDNRFRIDHDVKEVTFIIKRKPGSSSVILVRPDGSKLYVDRAKPPEVGWLTRGDQDLITLRNPMPGPWQAIGEVDPENRVRILSDVRLEAGPLPAQLYQGEVLKLKSWLLIDGAAPKEGYYLSDLGMTVTLQRFDEHGKPILEETLGHYLDDGSGLDEVPGDGVMTAEAVLDVQAGKYRARYSTGNEVFARARTQDVLLDPLPVNYTLAPPSTEFGARLSLLIDSDELDPASVVIVGKATNTAGGSKAFSAVATEPRVGIDLSSIKEDGQYVVEATLFGTTRLGREVQVRLPVKSFNLLPVPASSPVGTQSASAETQQASHGWLFWGLGGVLLLGGGGAVLWQKQRASQRMMVLQQAERVPVLTATTLDLNLPEQ